MTNLSLVSPDTAPDQEPYDPWSDPRGKVPADVNALDLVVQSVIKAGPVSGRRRLWECWKHELSSAQEISEERYPWEPPERVARISGYGALRALHRTLSIVSDLPTRNRLITLAADECDRLFGPGTATPDTSAPGKWGVVTCSRPGCGTTFSPRHPSARFCSPKCRTAVYDAKQRLKAKARVLWSCPALLSARAR